MIVADVLSAEERAAADAPDVAAENDKIADYVDRAWEPEVEVDDEVQDAAAA